MQRLHFIFHLIFYYAAWVVGIYLAANHYAWWSTAVIMLLVLAQYGWQRFIMHDTKNLYFMIVLLTVVGSIIDTIYLHADLINFESNPFAPYFSPPWMIAIWISFAMIYYALLKSLYHRYFLLGGLSLVGFTLAYYVGAEIGAASFPYGNLSSVLVGVTWSVALPVCMILYNSWTRKV